MIITTLPDVTGTTVLPREMSWGELVTETIAAIEYPNKAACPLIKLAMFGDTRTPRGSLRHDANIIMVSGVECDYDAGVLDVDSAAVLLEYAGIECVIYTSPSHTPAVPRWRVLAPCAGFAQADDRRLFAGRINAALGGVLANESFTLSQSFYFGRVAGVEYDVRYISGRCIDLVAIEPTYPANVIVNTSKEYTQRTDVTPDTIADLGSALDSIDADDYGEWIAVGQGLSCLGDVGFDLWLRWSATSSKFDDSVFQRWSTFTGDRTGFEAVFAKAQRNGWINPKTGSSSKAVVDTASVFIKSGDFVDKTGGFITPQQQRMLFKGCVYSLDLDQIFVPTGELLNKARFDMMFGGYKFILDHANTMSTKSAWEAATQNHTYYFPIANGICFRPELPPGEITDCGGVKCVNTYVPSPTPSIPGDVTPFTNHLEKLLPNDDDRAKLTAWMAALVQHPGAKFQWAPVVQGTKGNGKTFLITALEACIGERYSFTPAAGNIDSNFNSWIQRKLFIGVEELSAYHKKEVLESLLVKITNRRIAVEAKGVDQAMTDNRANFMFCINPKNGVPIDENERRYAIFHTAQQCSEDLTRDGMRGNYFPDLYDWGRNGGFAHVHHWLKNYQIPAEMNPATKSHRAPRTTSTDEAIMHSQGPYEQEILEQVGQGTYGFAGGWLSSIQVRKLFERKPISIRAINDMLVKMGYIPHPSLVDGRVDNKILDDGGRPRLFIKKGHLHCNITRKADVAKAYIQAQGTAHGFGQGEAIPGKLEVDKNEK